MLALNNQDEDIMKVRLKKTNNQSSFDTKKIKLRRTVRSGYLKEPLKEEHVAFLTVNDKDYFHFFQTDQKNIVC